MLCGIFTAPRPGGVSYLEKTLSSLHAAGATQIRVFSEPGVKNDLTDRHRGLVTWHQNPERLGAFRNWRKTAFALCDLAEQQRQSFVLLGEDDGLYEKNALLIAREIMSCLPPEVGFLSLYTSPFYQAKITESPLQIFQERARCGTVSLCFSVPTLRLILQQPIVENWPELRQAAEGGDLSQVSGQDVCLSRACEKLQLSHAVLKNGPVQHLGEISSLSLAEKHSQV